MKSSSWLIQIIYASQPLFLLAGIMLYGLGSAIARFLGRPIDAVTYILGQLLTLFIQLMAAYLTDYYERLQLPVNSAEITPSNNGRSLQKTGVPQRPVFYAGIICMTFVATISVLYLTRFPIPLTAWFLLLLIFGLAFTYSVPPFSLQTSGYGELAFSIVFTGLLPAFSFALHTGEYHRLLLMSTVPLTALHFALLITLQLRRYAQDEKYDRKTLMVRLGWSTAMKLHDYAILFAILSFVIAAAIGLPRRVAWGSTIALPLALAQIWQMARIRAGYPIRWRVLKWTARGLFGLATYLILAGYLLS